MSVTNVTRLHASCGLQPWGPWGVGEDGRDDALSGATKCVLQGDFCYLIRQ